MEAHARTSGTTIRFGNGFELNTASGELFKRGHRIRLQEQPFQVLVALLDRPGDVVTRDELQQKLWAGHAVASFDEGLNSAIRRLRFALGDAADQPRYVETLPRRGYRFIAPIERSVSALEPVVAPTDEPEPVPVRVTWNWRIAGAVMLLVAAALTAWLARKRADDPAPSTAAHTFHQVTRDSGVENNPTISPDGHFIAFTARAHGNEDIFLQAAGSYSRTNLTKDSAQDDRQPAFSPDGQLIAFRSERDGGGIFAMDLTGDSLRRLSDFGYDPAWSPDADEIVVASEGILTPLSRTSSSSLWRINLLTGRKTKIADGDAVQPSWSPHGHRIAFWGISSGGNRAIKTMPAGGGEAVAIVDDSAVNWHPVWSPDGKHLYFASDRGGAMNLWRIAIDEATGAAAGKPEAVTTPSVWSGEPSVSGDGRKIAFTAAQPRSNVERVSFDSKAGKTNGDSVAVTAQTIPVIQPDISPDGQWLAFRTESDPEDIYVSRTDGTALRRLTFDKAKDRAPSWSPDGSRIAFYSDRAGKYDIWVIGADGTGLQQITALHDWVSFPRWSPDGSRMVVNDSRGSYVIDLRGPLPVRQLSPLPAYPDKTMAFRAVSWSPDGQRLAGIRYRYNGTRVPGIAVYTFDSGEFQTVAEVGNWAAWLSDSRRLILAEENKLYIADTTSDRARELLAISGRIPPGLAVAPNDDAIYFSHSAAESDIWLASSR